MANRFEQYLTPAAAPRANRFAQFVESQPAPVADTNADRMPEPARLSFAPTPEQESLSARRDKLVTAGMEAYTRTPEGVAKLNAEARAAGIPLGRATQWKRKQLQREASGTDYADSLGILQPQEALSTVRGDAPSKRPVTAGDVGSMSNADRARIIDFADRIQSSPMAQWPAQGDMTSIPGDKEQEGRFAQAIAVLEQLRQKEAPHVPGDQFIRRIGAVADRQIPQRTDKPVTGYDAGATAEAFAGGLISGGGGLLRGIGENLNEAQRYVRGRSTLEEPNTFERVTQGIAETGSNIYDTGQAMSTEAAGGMLERPTTPFMDDPMAYARYYGQQALASSGATLVGVGAGAVNPTLGALAMGGTAFGQGYGDRRAAGQGVGSATRGGAVAAMAETIPEKFSLDVAFGKGVGKAIEESLSRRMLASGVVEPTTEMATEAINAGYEALGENKPVTFDQFKQRVFDAGIIGAISGPAVAGAIHTAQNAGDIRDQIDMARMRTGIKFNNAGLGGQQRTQATTARILSTADPAAAAGADIADQAFRNAGVGDQLTTASEVDSLLGGNIPAAEAAPPSAPVRIPGMAPAGVNVTVADAQPMQAPEVAQTAQTPTQFLPGNPAQIRQQLADAGLGIRGRVRVVNGVEGVEFGEGWADVLGVVGGNGARTDVPSADGAGRGEVSPTVAGSSLRDDLQAQPFDLGGSNDRLGLARQPATVSSASPAETPQPTQTEATVDGTLAGSGITGIGSNVPGNEPTGIDGTGGVVGNAQGAPALRSTAVFPTTGTTTVAESSAATSNQQGATPAPPALQDLTDDERNIWPALKSEVLDSVQNPGGRAILDPQTGAVVGRTKPAELGPVSGFWRQIPNSKWSSKTVIAALDAASTGAPLTTQQKNIVQYAKGWVREYAAEHKAQLAVAESDSRLAQREEVRGDIEATLPSVTDTSPQQRASVVSLGHDYTAKLLELKRARAAGRLNPDQSEAYIDLLEQDRETGKVAGRPMVGIGNKTAYVDALMQGKLMPVQAFLDADNFKALNDKFGHDVGDDVIRLIADVVREEFGDGNVFHRGGDEFLTQGMTQEEVDAKMARVQDYLARVNMELPLSDGRTATLTGVGVSYGTGANEKAADDSLKQDKQRRKDAGLRFDRREGDDSGSVGAQPVSAGIDASGTNSRDSTGTGAEGVGDAARVQNVADTGNEGTDGASGAAVGGPVSSGTARQDTATVPADVVGRDAGKRGDGVRETGTVQRDVLDASGALSELSSTLGPKFTQRLTAQPWFHLVETLGEIPDGVRKTLTDAETAAGFVHTNGHVYIIAGNIDAGNVTGVVLHEVGVHFGMSGILGDDFPVVLRNFKRMRAKGGAVARAYERVPKSTPADLIDEEALAYYVEENWNTDAPLIQRVVDAIKALLNRLGVPLSKLNASPSLLVSVAKGAADKASRGLVTVHDGRIVYSTGSGKVGGVKTLADLRPEITDAEPEFDENYAPKDDEYLYHVTSAPSARSIAANGFKKASKMFGHGAYAKYSDGRVFFTERSGLNFWKERVENQLFDQFDDPPDVAVVRVKRSDVEGMIEPDKTGSDDARRPAYFIATNRQAPPSEGLGASGPKYSRTIAVDGTERPTTDSTGKAIHPTEEGLRNFWRWFGNGSTNSDGKPVPYVHSSSSSVAPIPSADSKFGGVFAVESKSVQYGDFDHAFFVRGRIADTSDLRDAPDAARKVAARMFGIRGRAAEVAAESAISESDPSPEFSRIVRAIDAADAYTEMQRLRGEIARNLGFSAIWMHDETGRSLLMLSADDAKTARQANGELQYAEQKAERAVYEQPKVDEAARAEAMRRSADKAKAEAAARKAAADARNAARALKDAKDDLADAVDALYSKYGAVTAEDYMAETPEGRAEYRINPNVADRIARAESALRELEESKPTDRRIAYSRRSPAEVRADAAAKKQNAAAGLGVQPPATGAIGFAPTARSFRWEGVNGFLRRRRRELQDQMVAWRDVQKDIKDSGGLIDDLNDVYTLENLMHGRTADQLRRGETEMINPLRDVMTKHGIRVAELEDYLEAVYAPERNAAVLKVNPQNTSGSGMTDQQASDFLAGNDDGHRSKVKLTAARKAQLRDAEQIIRQITQKSRDKLLSSGVITPAMHATLTAEANYVPLRHIKKGDEEEAGDSFLPGIGTGLDVRSHGVKRALGRNTRAENILGEVIGNWQRAVILGEKNRVGQGILRQALQNPIKDVMEVEKVETELKYSEATGQAYVAAKVDTMDENTTAVFVDGVRYHVKLHPKLARAAKRLNAEPLGKVLGALASVHRMLAALYTSLSPTFAWVNPIRDASAGLARIWGEGDRKIAKDSAANWIPARAAIRANMANRTGTQWTALALPGVSQATRNKWVGYADEFTKSGAMAGFSHALRADGIQDEMVRKLKRAQPGLHRMTARGAKAILEYVENVNQANENALRLAYFVALRESGVSVSQAAQRAKNSTVNFNRKGELSTKIGAYSLFFNAAVQGSHSVVQTMRNPKVAAAIAAITAAAAALAVFGMDDRDPETGERYWDLRLSERDKERNFIIPLGGGEFIKIPMAYGFNVFPYAGVRIAEHFRRANDGETEDRGASVVGDIGGALANSFMPIDLSITSALPTALSAIGEARINENFFGSPVHPDEAYDQYETALATKYHPGTSKPAIAIAEALQWLGQGEGTRKPWALFDWSPNDIEYIAGQWTGGPGKIATGAFDAVADVLGGSAPSRDNPMNLANIVVSGGRNPDREVASRYRERSDELLRLIDEGKDVYAAQGEQAWVAFKKKHEEYLGGIKISETRKAGETVIEANKDNQFAEAFKDSEREIKALREQKRRVFNDQSIGFLDRRKKIEQIDAEVAKRQKEALKEFNSRRRAGRHS